MKKYTLEQFKKAVQMISCAETRMATEIDMPRMATEIDMPRAVK